MYFTQGVRKGVKPCFTPCEPLQSDTLQLLWKKEGSSSISGPTLEHTEEALSQDSGEPNARTPAAQSAAATAHTARASRSRPPRRSVVSGTEVPNMLAILV